MFKRILLHEFKNIYRDKMYTFLAFFAIMLMIIGYFLFPYLEENSTKMVSDLATLFFILMNSFMFGAITGFTLLDDQDDNVLLSLKITPVSVKKFVMSKLFVSYLFSVLATIGIISISSLITSSTAIQIIMIVILTSMQAPILALLVNMFANNKVEGFVIMKLSGIILMAPIAVLFLTDWKEIFIMILPGFWPARLISMELLPLDFFISNAYIYFGLGLCVNLMILYVFFKVYQKRVHI